VLQAAIHLIHHGIFVVLAVQEVSREVRQQVLEAKLAIDLAILCVIVTLNKREIDLVLVTA